MDDASRAEVNILMSFGHRTKMFSNMCRTTSRQEFIEIMKNWLKEDFPKNYSVSFYDRKFSTITELANDGTFYLAPIFESLSLASQTIGAQPLSSDDCSYIELFISNQDACDLPSLSPKALAREFQYFLDDIKMVNGDSTVVSDAKSWEGLFADTDTGVSLKDGHDKDPPNSDCVTRSTNESVIVTRHIPPTTNLQFRLIDHLSMVLDVCSTPKRRNYLSNMGKNKRGGLAYLSGVRGPLDRGKHIRPIILIPTAVLEWLQENAPLDLVIACVRETEEGDTRVWRIDTHNEFRTKGCTTATSGVNPLHYPLTLKAIKNGKLKLEVFLTRVPGQINTNRPGDVFHSLDKALADQLHPAPHDSESSRLALVVSCYDVMQMNTIGLTNFIHEPKRKETTASAQN